MPSLNFPSQADRPMAPLIWVEDRNGTGLPYSKGLMASSIMATGLPPQRAYELASSIELALRAQGSLTVCAETLRSTAVDVLRTSEGLSIADRYEAWRRAKRSPRPIVLLVGGATGVGKSTAASRLAARLDLAGVVQTDAVREVMRSLVSFADTPSIHRSSFESGGDIVAGFLEQSRIVAGSVASLVHRTVVERRDLIVEGVHVIPGMLNEPVLAAARDKAVLVQVLLTLQDRSVHQSHFLNRLENEHGRNPSRYLDHLEDIRKVDRHLVEMAHNHEVPVIEASSLDETVQRVIEVVVGEVISAESAPLIA